MSLFQIFKTTGLESNIWKYAVLLVTGNRIFIAILGVYYLTVPDVTIQSVGLILLISKLAGFVFEIPSGYLSDKIGHKQAIVISRIFIVISTLFFLYADSLSYLILGSFFLSLGHSFESGTNDVFMHETLRGLGKEKLFTQIMGRISSISFAVPIILMALIPFLVAISFKAPFIIALILDVIGLFVALLLVVPKVPLEHIKEVGVTNFRQVLQEGYRFNYFKFAIFIGITSSFIATSGMYRDIYQAFLGVPVIYFGIFFGLGRLLASSISAYSGKIKSYFSLLSFYRFESLLYLLLMLVLAFVENPWVVVTIFSLMTAVGWGLNQVKKGFLIEIIRESKFKATLLSVYGQVTLLFWGMLSFGFGIIIEQFSFKLGFLWLGIVFLVITIPFYWYIHRSYKK